MSNNKRLCKCGCGTSIENKSKNAKFLNSKHRSNYWNIKLNTTEHRLSRVLYSDTVEDEMSEDIHLMDIDSQMVNFY